MNKTNQTKTPNRLCGRGKLYTAIGTELDSGPLRQHLNAGPRREFREIEGRATLRDLHSRSAFVNRDQGGLGRWQLLPSVSLPGSDLIIGDTNSPNSALKGTPGQVCRRRRLSRRAGPLSRLCLQWSLEELSRKLASIEKIFRRSGNPFDQAVLWNRTTFSAAVEPPEMQMALCEVAHSALEFLRDHSSCPITILSNGPAVVEDFELLRSFGERLRFGVCIPNLLEDVLRAYEPETPSLAERLQTLRRAKGEGLRVFAAFGPLTQDLHGGDLSSTFQALLELRPDAVFCYGRQLSSWVATEIHCQAWCTNVGVTPELNTGVRGLRTLLWQMDRVMCMARQLNVADRLHFSPPWELTHGSYLRTLTNDERERHLFEMKRWMKRCQDWICGREVPV
ncbi:hypothetical protein ACXR0O_23330 [Verrucomicrobiota bacterium sgz303538]